MECDTSQHIDPAWCFKAQSTSRFRDTLFLASKRLCKPHPVQTAGGPGRASQGHQPPGTGSLQLELLQPNRHSCAPPAAARSLPLSLPSWSTSASPSHDPSTRVTNLPSAGGCALPGRTSRWALSRASCLLGQLPCWPVRLAGSLCTLIWPVWRPAGPVHALSRVLTHLPMSCHSQGMIRLAVRLAIGMRCEA